MKKLIVTLLTLTMVLALFTGCIDDIADEFGFSKRETQETPKILDKTQIDTAYPNHVYCSHRNAITVELAEEDLRKHSDHSALDRGTLRFDTCSLSNYRVTYVFTIRVEGERITNIYRATVSYNYKSVWGSENEYEYRFDSCEIALQGPA